MVFNLKLFYCECTYLYILDRGKCYVDLCRMKLRGLNLQSLPQDFVHAISLYFYMHKVNVQYQLQDLKQFKFNETFLHYFSKSNCLTQFSARHKRFISSVILRVLIGTLTHFAPSHMVNCQLLKTTGNQRRHKLCSQSY